MSLFERKYNGDAGKSVGHYFIIGRVKSIVLNASDSNFETYADIGKINFELLYSTLNTSISDNATRPAWPISSFTKQYPVIGEIVLIFTGPSDGLNDDFNNQKLYYFPPYTLWNAVNHNAFPNLQEYSQFLQQYSNKESYQGSSVTGSITELPKGKTFIEKDIKMLTPFEGDSIIEGRFGQSIRFGSTVTAAKKENNWSNLGENGSPITIIRNGQGKVVDPLNQFSTTVEDINTDASSIYLTNGQEIILEDINNFPKQSYGITVNNLQQPIIQTFKKPISNDAIDASTQDKNALS